MLLLHLHTNHFDYVCAYVKSCQKESRHKATHCTWAAQFRLLYAQVLERIPDLVLPCDRVIAYLETAHIVGLVGLRRKRTHLIWQVR